MKPVPVLLTVAIVALAAVMFLPAVDFGGMLSSTLGGLFLIFVVIVFVYAWWARHGAT